MPQVAIVIPPDGVNVRADADPDSAKRDRIGQGERVVVISSKRRGRIMWLKVRLSSGVIGWVCGKYMNIESAPREPEPDLPVEPAPIPAQPEPDPWVPPPDIEPAPESVTEQSREWLFIVLALAVSVALATGLMMWLG